MSTIPTRRRATFVRRPRILPLAVTAALLWTAYSFAVSYLLLSAAQQAGVL